MGFGLPIFFFPQGFMTGTMQTHARKHAVAINLLGFVFDVKKSYEVAEIEEPEDGVVCYGLFCDGGRWNMDKHCLDEPNFGEMFAEVPPIHFLPKLKKVRDPMDLPSEGVCSVPSTRRRCDRACFPRRVSPRTLSSASTCPLRTS